ncbi:MAG: hsdM [Microbacteriaceae bacterium]|nr:hsdM [Microbacteriaceae bacterium]
MANTSNETTGDTPRDVVRLMVDLILAPDAHAKRTVARSIYDPTAGTGGPLSTGEDRTRELGDTLLADKQAGTTFDYCLSNPPFGVDWKKQQREVTEEHKRRGFAGRFGAGLPRTSDGSMLYLMHLISKMREASDGAAGGRAAIVLGGSPLFTGGAGSGESNIRKWVLDNDYLEAIVALPSDLFYNTGIATYIWVLSKDKTPERQNKVQLIDGSTLLHTMDKAIGSKRNELTKADIDQIVTIYGAFEDRDRSKVLPREAFYYRTITVERPLRQRFQLTKGRVEAVLATKAATKLSDGDRAKLRLTLSTYSASTWTSRSVFSEHLAGVVKLIGLKLSATALVSFVDAIGEHDEKAEAAVANGKRVADPSRRDIENVPWTEDIRVYLAREVTPFAPDAWIDESKTKEGCEIPFTRHFYSYLPPRLLKDIDADLQRVLGRIRQGLEQVRA